MQDIDECSEDPTLCPNGECRNFPGSFRCECEMGFTAPSSGEQTDCVDIDECQVFPNICVHGTCENQNGMFKCYCDQGYKLGKFNQKFFNKIPSFQSYFPLDKRTMRSGTFVLNPAVR